jgi:hypothetical protein
MNGTKRVRRKKIINPLYLVPIARPQEMADMIKNLSLKPVSTHLINRKSDAIEKNMSPRSTYTVMESFTIMGIERKKVAPRRA